MVQDFSHITVGCSDLARSLQFYESLGLRVARRIGELDSEGVAKAFDLARGHLTVVHLEPAQSTWDIDATVSGQSYVARPYRRPAYVY